MAAILNCYNNNIIYYYNTAYAYEIPQVNNPILLCSCTSAKVAKEVLQALSEEVAVYSSKACIYSSYEELLGNSISMKKTSAVVHMKLGRGPNVAAVEGELSDVDLALTLRKILWEMQEEWDSKYSQWRATSFELLNVDNLQNDVGHFTQTVYMLEKGEAVYSVSKV